MKFWSSFLCLIASFAFADGERAFDIPAASAEQIADLAQHESSLIGGIVSPLSGQVFLHSTDLTAIGAQSISCHRTYLAPTIEPPISNPSHKLSVFQEQVNRDITLRDNYRGWTTFPHCFLRIFMDRIRVTDPSGMTLDFALSGQLLSLPFGLSNAAGDECSGRFDPRNTRLSISNAQIVVYAPDGAQRVYERLNAIFFRLSREILPNGKMLRYFYDASQRLSAIQSCDASGRFIYATLHINGAFAIDEDCSVANASGDTAIYRGRKSVRLHSGKFTTDKGAFGRRDRIKIKHSIGMPPIMQSASAPNFRQESVGYTNDFLLTSYVGKDKTFQCSYSGPIPRVDALALPVGDNGAYTPVYRMSYDPPILGQKGGTTVAVRSDGVKTVYHYSPALLITSIEWFSPDGRLAKQKQMQWDVNQRLQAVTWLHGNGEIYSKKRIHI